MESNKKKPDAMLQLASFIIQKRNAFIALFLVACVYCITSISKVQVNNELTDYLPDTTETRQGLTIMEDEFTTFGTAKILVTNITYENALALSRTLEGITGISSVDFYDRDDDAYEEKELTDYYKEASALYTLSFEEPEDTDTSQKAIAKAREAIGDYESWVYTTVDKDDAAELKAEMKVILAISSAVIFCMLLFTSKTYMEIFIFLMVFVMAAILNVGTNYWFKEISFVTNAVGIILQLALAIDYAIILFHRFMEEREEYGAEEAITIALSKAIPEISSSSLTTVSGLVALMFMQFEIGMDLGRALAKSIVFSLLTVFLFMPALILMFSEAIDRTGHKSFVPSIRFWGTWVIKLRFLFPVFLVLSILGAVFSGRCHYIYDINSITSEKLNEYLAARERISETFPVTNLMAVIVPKGDYQKEGEIIRELERLEAVDTVMGLANIEVDDDGHILVDELNPLEFSELADVDLDLVRLLFRFYVLDHNQYGRLLQNIDDCRISVIDLVDFIYEQKEIGAIDFDEDQSEDIDSLYESVCDARAQLEGEDYSRIVFTFEGPVEGETPFALVDTVRDIVAARYEESYVVGDATSNYELSESFLTDNVLISLLTALFVGIILLFTFQSAGLPFMLLLTIQSSIWINFSIPYLTDSTMFFLSYLIVSAIQMGATIDYAIVITSRYTVLRKTESTKREAIITALDQAFPTVATSGSILTCAGFVVGKLTSNPVIASLGTALGRGTLISIILVMTALPQILFMFDKFIDMTQLFKGSFISSGKGGEEK